LNKKKKTHYIKLSVDIKSFIGKCVVFIHTVDAFCVCNLASGVQGIIILLVAHERVHPQDGCEDISISLVDGLNIQYSQSTVIGCQ